MEYRNELVEEGIGKLVHVQAMGAENALQTVTWLARLDGYDAVGVRFRIPSDAPPEQQTRGYCVPWSAIFYLEVAED